MLAPDASKAGSPTLDETTDRIPSFFDDFGWDAKFCPRSLLRLTYPTSDACLSWLGIDMRLGLGLI